MKAIKLAGAVAVAAAIGAMSITQATAESSNSSVQKTGSGAQPGNMGPAYSKGQ